MRRPGLDHELAVDGLGDLREGPDPVDVPRVEGREDRLPLRPARGLDALRLHGGLGEIGPCVVRRDTRALRDQGDRFVRPRRLDEVAGHLRVRPMLTQVAGVRHGPFRRVDEEPVRGGSRMVDVDRLDLDAVRVHSRARTERAVVVGEEVHAAGRDLPRVEDDLRPDAEVHGDPGVEEPQMVRVVEVDVRDEDGRKPRRFVGQVGPVQPVLGIEAGQFGEEAEGEVISETETIPRQQILDEEVGPEVERGAHVEPDAGIPVLDQDLVSPDLADAPVEAEIRHGSLRPAVSRRAASRSRPSRL